MGSMNQKLIGLMLQASGGDKRAIKALKAFKRAAQAPAPAQESVSAAKIIRIVMIGLSDNPTEAEARDTVLRVCQAFPLPDSERIQVAEEVLRRVRITAAPDLPWPL
jgi:hypothetical protein